MEEKKTFSQLGKYAMQTISQPRLKLVTYRDGSMSSMIKGILR
jgi:hypothetical protein